MRCRKSRTSSDTNYLKNFLMLLLGLLLISLVLVVPIGVGSASFPPVRSSSYSSHGVTTTDLSFQFHLEKEVIIDTVRLKLLQNDQSDDYNLDVSNSKLADDGISKLVQCIHNVTACRRSSSNAIGTKTIRLEARMNQITMTGMVHMIQELLLPTSASLQINNTTANATTSEALLPESEQQSMGKNSHTASNNTHIVATRDGDKHSIILANLTDITELDNIVSVGNNTYAASNYTNTAAITDEEKGSNVLTNLSGRTDLDNNTSTTSTSSLPPNFYIQLLDLGWNAIGGTDDYEGSRRSHISSKKLYKSIRELIQSSYCCPEILHLEQCGISVGFCRAIGKGLINHYQNRSYNSCEQHYTNRHSLRNLYLSGNPKIGDAGTAAIAAALRNIFATSSPLETNNSESTQNHYILEVLDLSSCNIGDAGMEALALALSDGNYIVQHLDLSNNDISDHGATLIANALLKSTRRKRTNRRTEDKAGGYNGLCSLRLDNNPKIGDSGAIALAACIAAGRLKTISLRSCSIQAKGITAFSKALIELSSSSSPMLSDGNIHLDFSGNKFGIFKPHRKKKTATATISDFAATKAAYFSQKLTSTFAGVRRSGTAFIGDGSTDSDAEEDNDFDSMIDMERNSNARIRSTSSPCGARSFADPFVTNASTTNVHRCSTPCFVGMRHCALDNGAIDALAAAVLHAKEYYKLNVSVDVTLNSHIADEWRTESLDIHNPKLSEMATRYNNAREAMRISQERAKALERASVDRQRAETAFDNVLSSILENENDYVEEEDEWEDNSDDHFFDEDNEGEVSQEEDIE